MKPFGDLLEVDPDLWPETDVDLVVAGPPCQPWSKAGKGGGLEDARGPLLLEFRRHLKKLNPKVFVLEMVKGLLSETHAEIWALYMRFLGTFCRHSCFLCPWEFTYFDLIIGVYLFLANNHTCVLV